MTPNRRKWLESKKRQRKKEEINVFLADYLHQKIYFDEITSIFCSAIASATADKITKTVQIPQQRKIDI